MWNQGITRTRWLAAKLGVATVAAAVAGTIGLGMTWWSWPLDDAVLRGYTDGGPLSAPRLWPEVFGTRGVVPVAMTVLALVVGVAAGLVVRRTVAAMALTVATIVAVQIAMPMLVQSRLVATHELTTDITASNVKSFMMSGEPGAADPRIDIDVATDKPGAWITENVTVDADGNVVDLPAWAEDCAAGPQVDSVKVDACFDRLAAAGYQQRVRYHPASRFWALQWRETGILVLLAAEVASFCFWRIRRDFT